MRQIDGDALKITLDTFATIVGFSGVYDRSQVMECIDASPTVDVWTSGKWVSVNDRLPESEQYVILWTKTGVMKYAKYLDDEPHRPWITYDENGSCRAWDNVVTHWMPMPEPPKEETP